MSIELKIKSKHLSEEAKIIRHEEHKLKKQVRYNVKKHHESGANGDYEYWKDPKHQKRSSLTNHRRWDVRNEARATYLARAYIAGKSYKSVENKCNDIFTLYHYILPRITRMVIKYGRLDLKLELGKDLSWNKNTNHYDPTKEFKQKILDWLKE